MPGWLFEKAKFANPVEKKLVLFGQHRSYVRKEVGVGCASIPQCKVVKRKVLKRGERTHCCPKNLLKLLNYH
jgi:hypothetical protein